MTGKEVQKIIGKMMVLKGHNPVAENVKFVFSHWEHDIISINKSGFIYEFEVKISKRDFINDSKKDKIVTFYNNKVSTKMPNYFSYACPENLIDVKDVPEYAGLIYIVNGEPKEIKKAKLIHKHKHDVVKLAEKINRVYSERQFLGCCLLTYKHKELKENLNLLEHEG